MRWNLKLLLPLVLLVAVLLALLLATPLYAIHGIRTALRDNDDVALARHIDFPALRGNLRAQSEDYLARQVGPSVRDNLLGSIALDVAGRLTGGLVESAATPEDVRMLMAGRAIWRQGTASGLDAKRPLSTEPPEDPFEHAHYRFESLDRFSASIDNEGRLPVEVVLRRQGLRWKIAEINLGTQEAR